MRPRGYPSGTTRASELRPPPTGVTARPTAPALPAEVRGYLIAVHDLLALTRRSDPAVQWTLASLAACGTSERVDWDAETAWVRKRLAEVERARAGASDA